ncbi:unnamed protein product [Sphagnum jensenii]|uniref:Uncharacterized protein n=1 Tax=Sphagnum jensenii TaxID=128206 RepID=A0ABP1C0T1_9BRYO
MGFVGTCPHRERDYHIGSNFWKFYLIRTSRTSFTLSESISLVKVFRLEQIVLVFRNRRSSISSTESVVEEASEEAWERRRRDSRSSSSSLTRSLTDEDMDELRGCIDLGFGFSKEQEDMELCNTLPALELCYAITRQYNDVVTGRSSSSPISTSGRSSNSISRSFDQTSSSSSSSLDRTSSSSSLLSSPMESWRISSPGDHPSQVKTRLRHWAQAVACTLRQSC